MIIDRTVRFCYQRSPGRSDASNFFFSGEVGTIAPLTSDEVKEGGSVQSTVQNFEVSSPKTPYRKAYGRNMAILNISAKKGSGKETPESTK